MTTKTIKMPKAMLDAWLSALLSGEYKQAFGRMEHNGGYCCLGVLQHCVDGDVERFGQGPALAVPTKEWLEKNAVTFLDSKGHWDDAPHLPKLAQAATKANDCDTPFTAIADAIEACAEAT